MSQLQLLSRVVSTLDRLDIPYMLTGSLVSSAQGAPRLTHDIDIVVQISPASAAALVAAFSGPEFYLDGNSVLDAIRTGTQFNLLEPDTGEKVDFWLLTGESFDQSRFARRTRAEVMGLRVPASTPEDTILQKLHWAEMSGGSQKQFNDALHVFELQHGRLDLAYLSRWSAVLGIAELYQRLQREAQPL